MLSRRVSELFHSLAFRLSLFFTALFSGAAVAVSVFFFAFLQSNLARNVDRSLLDQTDALRARLEEGGFDALAEEITREAHSTGTSRVFARILAAGDEAELTTSDTSAWANLPSAKALFSEKATLRPQYVTLQLPGEEHRTRILQTLLSDDIAIQIARSLKAEDERLDEYQLIFFITTSLLIIFAGVVGFVIARRAIRNVDAIRRVARSIADGELEASVPVRGTGDELDHLAEDFNHMLARIRDVMREMRELNDNIAHELRSPLTILRGNAELALLSTTSEEQKNEALALAVQECDSLLALINTMLDISESESGVREMADETVDLAEIARSVCDLFQPLLEDKCIRLETALAKHCYIVGDTAKLHHALFNLLDNACKYSEENGCVTVSMRETSDEVEVTVADNGPGMSEEEATRVFERFYRADHSRATVGNGLGLPLARAFVGLHGGDVLVETKIATGTSVIIRLPKRSHLHADSESNS